jgi:hypothetical protein
MTMKINAKVVGYGPDPETTKALVNIIVEFSGPTETMTGARHDIAYPRERFRMVREQFENTRSAKDLELTATRDRAGNSSRPGWYFAKATSSDPGGGGSPEISGTTPYKAILRRPSAVHPAAAVRHRWCSARVPARRRQAAKHRPDRRHARDRGMAGVEHCVTARDEDSNRRACKGFHCAQQC